MGRQATGGLLKQPHIRRLLAAELEIRTQDLRKDQEGLPACAREALAELIDDVCVELRAA